MFSCTEEEIMTKIPHVYIKLCKGKEKALMMIDSGAEINLLKKSSLPKNLKPYNFRLILKGICGGKSSTLGVVKCKIGKTRTIFHIIENEEQFKCDGILGSEFLQDSNSSISFEKNKILLEDTEIDFVPVSKKVQSSLEMINNRRKQLKNDDILEF